MAVVTGPWEGGELLDTGFDLGMTKKRSKSGGDSHGVFSRQDDPGYGASGLTWSVPGRPKVLVWTSPFLDLQYIFLETWKTISTYCISTHVIPHVTTGYAWTWTFDPALLTKHQHLSHNVLAFTVPASVCFTSCPRPQQHNRHQSENFGECCTCPTFPNLNPK
jgi:hypothetical protein